MRDNFFIPPSLRPTTEPELNHADIRSNVLNWALNEIEHHGLGVSLDHINFQAIAKHAGVSRSSAQRIWPNRSLFIQDLLREITSLRTLSPLRFAHTTFATAFTAMHEHLHDADTAEGRYRMWLAGAAAGFEAHVHSVVHSPLWQTNQAVTATILSLAPGEFKTEIVAAASAKQQHFIDAVADLQQLTAELLGIVPTINFPTPWRTIASMAHVLTDGTAHAELYDMPGFNTITDTDIFGFHRDWSPATIMYCSVVKGVTASDPGAQVGSKESIAHTLRVAKEQLMAEDTPETDAPSDTPRGETPDATHETLRTQ